MSITSDSAVDDVIDFNEDTALDLILATVKNTPNPRHKFLFESLFRHLVAFIREVRPTVEELHAGRDFLKHTGQMSTDARDEFALLDAVLGTDMLVDVISLQRPEGATVNSALGPFFNPNAPPMPYLADLTGGVPGDRVVVYGQVKTLGGTPIAGADMDIWQTDEDGNYDVQVGTNINLRGKFVTDDQGRYGCIMVRACHYDVPMDGTGGKMLRTMGRTGGRPGHIHVMVKAPGYDTLVTAIFPSGDPLMGTDAAFAVRTTLIASYRVATEADAERFSLLLPFLTMPFDFVLAPQKA